VDTAHPGLPVVFVVNGYPFMAAYRLNASIEPTDEDILLRLDVARAKHPDIEAQITAVAIDAHNRNCI